jgi:hypothetical protein
MQKSYGYLMGLALVFGLTATPLALAAGPDMPRYLGEEANVSEISLRQSTPHPQVMLSSGSLFQPTSQALSNAAHNATTAQQNANTILQATTTQGVALLYGVDTSATAVGIAQIMAAQQH